MKTLTTKFIVILFLIAIFNASAQTPIILKEWASYSGISDSAFKNPVLTDGIYSYVATVAFDSATGPNISVIKYDENGGRVWGQIYSGLGYGRDQTSGMVMDDDFLYICGASFSSANNFDYVIVKLKKSDGNIQWLHTFNGAASNYDVATAIVVHDSSVYVTGVSFNTGTAADYHTIKYHKDGTYQWSADFDYNNLMDIPFALSYSEYDDSTLIVTGGSQNNIYDYDYQTIIYDYSGNILHQNRVSGSSAGFDRAQAVTIDASGNIYLTGGTYESGTSYDIKNVKLDKTGNLLWLNHYDSGMDDIGIDIIVDSSGQAYICGVVNGGGQEFFAARLKDQDGSVTWSHTIGDNNNDDSARAMCFDSWGNIVVTGQVYNPNTYSFDFLTVAYKPNGDEIWRDYFDGPSHGADNATDITADNNGNIYVTGQVTTEEGIQTVTIKYRTDYFTEPPAVDTPSTAYLFYPNEGQLIDVNDSNISDSVHYYTVHHYPQLFFGFGQMNMVWNHLDGDTSTADSLQRVDVSFLNSSNQSEGYPADEDDSTNVLNYFLANCSNGITNIHGNRSLVYTDVWSDIDVMYSSNNAGLKLTFICNPGSTPQEIGLSFDGHDDLSIYQNWFLKVHTILGDYNFEKARIYQLDDSNHRVTLNWQLAWNIPQAGQAVFTGWDTYNPYLPLIIEIGPQTMQQISMNGNLEWSTYFAGSSWDEPRHQVVDENGNIFICGYTESSDFPIVTGLYPSFHGIGDAFISRFNLVGDPVTLSNLKWSTFIGGTYQDVANGIDINITSQELYIVGQTSSSDFPIFPDITNTNPFNQNKIDNIPTGTGYGNYNDGFIVRINTSGNNISWSSFIGGADRDIATNVVINKNTDEVYVIGQTKSDGSNTTYPSIVFPLVSSTNLNSYNQNVYAGPANTAVTSVIGDGFIMKFDKFNENKWASFFGGNGDDFLERIKILSNNNVIVVGYTTSNNPNNPTTSAPCLANNIGEYPDCDNDVTNSNDFYINSNQGGDDGILICFNSNDQLIWSSFFGSSGEDRIFGLDVMPGSTIFSFSGGTTSTTNFPTYPTVTGSAYVQSYGGGTRDAFVATFNSFFRSWCSYFGGSGNDYSKDICYDANKKIYLTGSTTSSTPQSICLSPTVAGSFPICLGPGYYTQSVLGIRNDFVASFDQNDNSLFWSTYLGGSAISDGNGIIMYNSPNNTNNKLYVVSFEYMTSTPSFPIVNYTNSLFHGGYGTPSFQNRDCIVSRFDLPLPTNITDISNDEYIKVFPNPLNGKLTIENAPNSNTLECVSHIFIYNSLGQSIFSKKYNKQKIKIKEEIDFSSYENGIYLVQIILQDGSIIKKIVKQ